MVIIRILDSAFDRLVARAYETLRVETIGTLYGDVYYGKNLNRFVVEQVDPAQIADRKVESAVIGGAADERLSALLGEGIGLYHSHPYRVGFYNGETYTTRNRVFLGKTDFETLRELYPEGIQVVVSLNPAERMSRIKISENLVSGCFSDKGKKYRFNIGGYYLDKIRNGGFRKRRARISVPFKKLKIYF